MRSPARSPRPADSPAACRSRSGRCFPVNQVTTNRGSPPAAGPWLCGQVLRPGGMGVQLSSAWPSVTPAVTGVWTAGVCRTDPARWRGQVMLMSLPADGGRADSPEEPRVPPTGRTSFPRVTDDVGRKSTSISIVWLPRAISVTHDRGARQSPPRGGVGHRRCQQSAPPSVGCLLLCCAGRTRPETVSMPDPGAQPAAATPLHPRRAAPRIASYTNPVRGLPRRYHPAPCRPRRVPALHSHRVGAWLGYRRLGPPDRREAECGCPLAEARW